MWVYIKLMYLNYVNNSSFAARFRKSDYAFTLQNDLQMHSEMNSMYLQVVICVFFLVLVRNSRFQEGAGLAVPQMRVFAVAFDEVRMRAIFCNPAVGEDDDAVETGNR